MGKAAIAQKNPPIHGDEFAEAFDLLENTRRNVFITGNAGTGKSTFLQRFREKTQKKIAVVAPTGVAALNVQGQTIHSLFRLKPSFVNIDELRPNRSRVLKEIELLIVDEISMARADVFDGMDHTLRRVRRNRKPFGGVQICVIGDLFQLPPVVGNEEKEFFSAHYRSPFFFSSKAYDESSFQTVRFGTIYRQQDAGFIRILNSIREGSCEPELLDELNSRFNPKVTPAPGTLVLTATNFLADEINNMRLRNLAGTARSYEGDTSGEFGMKGTRLPSPENLTLKTGAQVMFVKNDPEGRWVNGTIGEVEGLSPESVFVRVGSETYEVVREKWKSVGYEFDEAQQKIVEKTLGTYTQFPLMLAWAVTIHKSQGKTLERVIIDLGRGAFAAGQLYVALSRCKSLSGIALKTPVTQADILCDREVVEFMKRI